MLQGGNQLNTLLKQIWESNSHRCKVTYRMKHRGEGVCQSEKRDGCCLFRFETLENLATVVSAVKPALLSCTSLTYTKHYCLMQCFSTTVHTSAPWDVRCALKKYPISFNWSKKYKIFHCQVTVLWKELNSVFLPHSLPGYQLCVNLSRPRFHTEYQ